MNDKIKKINSKYLHIAIIILGIIFISVPIFHENIWFDESYTVGIVNKSFTDIWNIGSKDVHPVFYYFCLHLLNLIFGNNIIVYRIFSAITIALLGILGYTHIRKDFGEKVGFLFSFLVYFLPISAQYASEIRMYGLGMLLGTIMAIYAYRIYKGNINKVTYIFFGLSSLLVSYTHYYGLMLAGIINLLLFIYLCKNRRTRKKDLIKFTITAVIQVIAYLPWLICFLKQVKGVSGGFWITLSFPGTLYDILTLQYRGNLEDMPIMLSTIFYAYIVYLASQTRKEDRKPATWCLYIYIAIILVALVVSLCMHTAILLSRYLVIATGLLMFAIAFFMANDQKKWRVMIICITIIIISTFSNLMAIRENYDERNKDCVSYLQDNIQEDDIIVYTNVINGAVITTQLSSNIEIHSYFYDEENWNVDEPYKAFSPYMEIKDTLEEILDNYTGRIWVLEGGNTNKLEEQIEEKYSITKIEEKQFEVPYRDYSYTINLIEKSI